MISSKWPHPQHTSPATENTYTHTVGVIPEEDHRLVQLALLGRGALAKRTLARGLAHRHAVIELESRGYRRSDLIKVLLCFIRTILKTIPRYEVERRSYGVERRVIRYAKKTMIWKVENRGLERVYGGRILFTVGMII